MKVLLIGAGRLRRLMVSRKDAKKIGKGAKEYPGCSLKIDSIGHSIKINQ
jgi:hypothetical protein